MSLLQTSGLCAAYGPVRALDGVTIEIRPGQMVGIIGRNGAGKSTLLQSICGLVRPTAGTVSFDGRRLDGMRPNKVLAAGVAYVPEGRRIFANMSVAENLRIGAFRHLSGSGGSETARRQIDRVFAFFPLLSERAAQPAGTLSGGQQQMLAIGRALMSDPKLLLLDEPSMGLAPVAFQALFERIEELRKSGLTILIVEQKAYITLRMVDYAYVINQGRIVLSGEGAALLASPEIQATYLGGGKALAATASAGAVPLTQSPGSLAAPIHDAPQPLRIQPAYAAAPDARLGAPAPAGASNVIPLPTPRETEQPAPAGGLAADRESAMRRRHRHSDGYQGGFHGA